ncbi:hypothetical protein SISSUDRAFT_979643 [Sistotremastrum suecicum HHB10207 ss-3]|uniref:GH16 domain-containing protein n=1 Tax=Sistotremastrum suecicum HHB10207 ss-3 TaxID=1314776 RepID=A0A166HK29_9AGAM|nr:hypothetical protein SISSUDRAFT_979643 [Sistotremastrum suecicum HHB10207 ss-3]
MAIEGLGSPAPPHLKKRAQPGGARCRVQQSVQSVSGSGGVGSGGFSNVTGSSSSETQSGHSTSATSSKSASSQSAKSSSSSSSSSSQASATPSSGPPPFTLVNGYTGNDFFNGWSFQTGADPTEGIVNFLSADDAKNAGLAYVNGAGNFVMGIETTPTVANTRNAVRITSQASFNGGLVIMDAVHMPTGCGTWPAFWSNGPGTWPQNGEIDIVEGVNDYIENQSTVHTRPGCSIAPSYSSQSTAQLVGEMDCAVVDTNNQGCGMRNPSNVSYGAPFNSNGGGVYAMLWDNTGIAVYFFPRNGIPGDITSGQPNPASWPLPAAKWPAAQCPPYTFFEDHSAIFDTTLCGEWAGNVWNDAGIPGQEQSCAQRTGFADCESFVRASGSAFQVAYWEVKSVNIYQPTS